MKQRLVGVITRPAKRNWAPYLSVRCVLMEPSQTRHGARPDTLRETDAPPERNRKGTNVSIPALGTSLLNGGDGTTNTVPRVTDNARRLTTAVLAGCVITGEPVAEALDSASHLILVIIVLVLVGSHLRRSQGAAIVPRITASS